MITSDSSENTSAAAQLVSPIAMSEDQRCDCCGAKAYVLAVVGRSALTFCLHHGRKHYDGLVAAGARIISNPGGVGRSAA
jgi:hypothetical protein